MCKFKWRLPCVFLYQTLSSSLNVSIERYVSVVFWRNIILHKNALWRDRVQNKLLTKADIMNDNVHRSTNLSNKILLVFISELLFPSVWIFYSFLCFYESSVTINVTLFIKKRKFYKTVNNTIIRITFGLRVHANWHISNNNL